MQILSDCLELRRKITKLEEKLEEISDCIRYPKSQTMSDMPRGAASTISPIERYIIKQDEYQNDKLLLENTLRLKWNEVNRLLVECGVDKPERYLMYLRFHNGYSWRKCTATMENMVGTKWNENKTFRTYRKIILLLQKNEQKIVENAN